MVLFKWLQGSIRLDRMSEVFKKDLYKHLSDCGRFSEVLRGSMRYERILKRSKRSFCNGSILGLQSALMFQWVQ